MLLKTKVLWTNILLSLLEECLMNFEILPEHSKNVSSSLGLHNVNFECSLKQVVVMFKKQVS